MLCLVHACMNAVCCAVHAMVDHPLWIVAGCDIKLAVVCKAGKEGRTSSILSPVNLAFESRESTCLGVGVFLCQGTEDAVS
jgi:hypothetical protein